MAASDDKEKDGRDIWDKVLEYAPVGGAIVGGLVGRRLGRKYKAKFRRHDEDPLYDVNKIGRMSEGGTTTAIQNYERIARERGVSAANDWLKRNGHKGVKVARALRKSATIGGAALGGGGAYEATRRK